MAVTRTLWTLLLCLALSAHVAALEMPAPGAPDPDEENAIGQAPSAPGAVERAAAHAEGVAASAGSQAAADARAHASQTLEAGWSAVDDAQAVVDALKQDPLAFAEGTVIRPAEREVGRLTSTIVLAPAPEGVEEDDEEPLAAEAVAQEPFFTVPMLIASATAAAAAGVAIAWFAAGSSGAVGTGAKAMGTELRRVLPYASPLFTRFEKDTVMGHPKREELYAAIVDEPGVPLHALCRRTGLSRTAVLHHLRLLEHHHLVVSRRVGRSRHYFENGGRYGRDQKEAYAVLQNDRSRTVAQFIRDHPGTIQKRMCDALGLQASIAHWHVRRLQEASLVEPVRRGRTVSYFPTADLQSLA